MAEEQRSSRWGAKQWGILLLGVLVVPSVASWVGSSAGEASAQRTALQNAPAFKAMAGSQSADGVTEEMMDQNFLANLEQHTVEQQIVNTRRALEASGMKMPVPRPASSSVFVMSGGHKITVVRTQAGSEGAVVHSAHLMAIFGDEARRVVCISTEGQISVTYGPCADKIEETFGFRL